MRVFSVDAAKTLTDNIKLTVDAADFILEDDPNNRDTKMSKGVQLFRRIESSE